MTTASCVNDHTTVDGIRVEHTLYENLSSKEKKELTKLIQATLSHDERALGDLSRFWCGGAAGCYDLGYVVTQLIYRIGEENFAEMASRLEIKQRQSLKGLIDVGLEYGDNNNDGKMDNKQSADEFPRLFHVLSL